MTEGSYILSYLSLSLSMSQETSLLLHAPLNHYFLFSTNIPLNQYTLLKFTHPSINTDLHILDNMNNAVVYFLLIVDMFPSPLDTYPEVVLLGNMINLYSAF